MRRWMQTQWSVPIAGHQLRSVPKTLSAILIKKPLPLGPHGPMAGRRAQDLGSTETDGFQSSCAPSFRWQPAPLHTAAHVPSTVLGTMGRCRTMGPGRAGLFSLLILTLPLELGGRGLLLVCQPGHVDTAFNGW